MASNNKFGQLKVVMEGDTSGLRKAIAEATSDLRGLEKNYNLMNQRIKNNPLELNIFGDDESTAYDEQLENIKKQLKEVNDVYDELNQKKIDWDKKEVDKQTDSYQLLAKTINEYHNKKEKLIKLEENYSKKVKVSNALVEKIRTTYNDSASALKNIEQRYREIDNAIRQTPNNLELYAKKQELVEEAVKATTDRLDDLKNVQSTLNNGYLGYVDKSSESYKKLENEIVLCHNKLLNYQEVQKELPNDIEKINNELNSTSDNWDEINSRIETQIKSLDGVIKATSSLSKISLAIGSSSIKNAVSYEKSIASIKKVITDLSDDTVEELKNVAVETGNAFENISTVATLGATLGIAQDDITAFTKTLIDLNTATDGAITTDEGAKSVARFLNVMGIGTDKVSNFGSALVYVGDQFAATADEVLEVSTRMAGLNTIAGVSQYDLIGLAAEMKNLGLSSESSSSAMTRVFMTINNAVASGEETLKKYADVAGMSADEFAKAWEDDAMNAFLDFTDGIDTSVINEISEAIENNTDKVDEFADAMGMSKEAFIDLFESDPTNILSLYADSMADLSDESQTASQILDDLGLTNVRTAETLLKLAGNGNVVKEAIKDASDAWEENTALTNKANTVYETVANRWEAVKEKAKQAISTLAEHALPTIEKVLDIIIDALDSMENMSTTAKKVIDTFLIFGTVTAPIAKVGQSLLTTNKNIIELCKTTDSLSSTYLTNLLTKLGGANGLTGILTTAMPAALGIGAAALTAFALHHAYATNEVNRFNNEIKGFADEASTTYVNSIVELNKEFSNIPTTLQQIEAYQNQLTFKNGEVDTSTQSYKNLVTALQNYNDTVGSSGGTIAYLDEATGKIVNQKGEVINLENEYENLYYAKEKEAWLSAHQEEYNNYLQIQSERLSELEEKQIKINDAKQKFLENNDYFTEADWTNFENVQKGLTDINDLSVDAQTKVQELQNALQETDLRSVLGDLGDWSELFASYDKATEFINTFNTIDATPITEVHDALKEITQSDNEIAISYNAESVDSIKGAIDEVDTKIQALKDMAAAGIDTTEMQAKYNDYKTQLISELEEAEQAAATMAENTTNDINESVNEAINGGEEKEGIIGLISKMAEAWDTFWLGIEEKRDKQYGDIYEPTASAIKDINALQLEPKEATYTIKVKYDLGPNGSELFNTITGGSKSGGYFGNIVSEIPTARIDSLTGSIGKTISNARQAQSKIASGGYSNQISLNASFNINNNGQQVTQSLAKQMAKQVVDYVNEELGKAV